MQNIFKYIFMLFVFATISMAETNQMNSNIIIFQSNQYVVPNDGLQYPEVQALFQTNQFHDVYEPDSETALRRFEIEFFISLPPVLILNTLLLKVLTTFENGYIGGEFDITRNIYLYSSSVLIAGAIAYNDYKMMRYKKKQQGVQWTLFRKKF